MFQACTDSECQVFSSVLQARACTEGTIFSSREWTKHALVVNARPFHLKNLKNMLAVVGRGSSGASDPGADLEIVKVITV